MSLDATLDAVRAASGAFLDRLECNPPADRTQRLPQSQSIVVECAYADETWTVYCLANVGGLRDDCTAYVSPVPNDVRTRGELIEYMMGKEWDGILFSIFQDFEGVRSHKPD